MSDPVLWFEVVGKNGAELRKFYNRLFGWEIAAATGGSDYGLVTADKGGIGGGVGTSEDGGAGHVTFFVEVDDPTAYLKKAEKLGGKTLVPPTELPDYNLTFAYFTDPEGHLIGLSKGMARQ
jgi:predicted enzyme related to lactoylglutathione lyase